MATDFDEILPELKRLKVRQQSIYAGWDASIWLDNRLIGLGRDVASAEVLLEPLRTELTRRAEIDRLRRALGEAPYENGLFQENGDYKYIRDPSIDHGPYPHVVLQVGGLPQLAFCDFETIGEAKFSGEAIAILAASALNFRVKAEQMRATLIDQEQQARRS